MHVLAPSTQVYIDVDDAYYHQSLQQILKQKIIPLNLKQQALNKSHIFHLQITNIEKNNYNEKIHNQHIFSFKMAQFILTFLTIKQKDSICTFSLDSILHLYHQKNST